MQFFPNQGALPTQMLIGNAEQKVKNIYIQFVAIIACFSFCRENNSPKLT